MDERQTSFARSPFIAQPYDPTKQREWIRDSVALAVLVFFIGIVGFALHAAPDWTAKKEMMQIIFPAVTSILGTVLGFYFGSQKLS